MHNVDRMFKPINLVSNENPKQNLSRFGLKAESQKSNSVGRKTSRNAIFNFHHRKHRFLAKTIGQIINGFQFVLQSRINVILSTTVPHFSRWNKAVSDFNKTIIQNVLENDKDGGRM